MCFLKTDPGVILFGFLCGFGVCCFDDWLNKIAQKKSHKRVGSRVMKYKYTGIAGCRCIDVFSDIGILSKLPKNF